MGSKKTEVLSEHGSLTKLNSLCCYRTQNEVELMESASRSQRALTHNESERKTHEITLAFNRDQSQQQSQTDVARKQLQSLLEKEKTYKHEISELKQQLSRRLGKYYFSPAWYLVLHCSNETTFAIDRSCRRYMAVKSQEKKASQRETQLERKVKSLEEELEKARVQLDREYLAQETKRAKVMRKISARHMTIYIQGV